MVDMCEAYNVLSRIAEPHTKPYDELYRKKSTEDWIN